MLLVLGRIRLALFIGAMIGVALGSARVASGGETADLARVRRAIDYLDDRQDAWARFAKAERGEAADKTTCVSCHTGISYALARHALGRFAAEPRPSAAEERIVAHARLRAGHWDELDSDRFQLMYDHDDRKKVESRGTEAVLSALILARDDAARGRQAPSAATATALKNLWATQVTEGKDAGSWVWLNFGLEPWEAKGSRAFGAALAAIAIGSVPGNGDQTRDEASAHGIALLRDYLRGRFPEENLYNRLWIVEASSALQGLLSPEQKREVIDQLCAAQHDDGGWALTDFGKFARVDGTDQVCDAEGYATGLAVHMLLGRDAPSQRKELAKGLDWLRSHQNDDGSWPGRSVNKKRDPATFAGKLMTDAATAIAALALAEAAE
jgi:hypothetical protein